INNNLISISRHFDETISDWHQHPYQKSKKKSKESSNKKRRLIIDDEQLDALLNDEIEIKDFLDD
ncbi:MAG: hypothetical protein WCR60_01985, partial [Patescibacteria group bacterium]